MTLVTCSNMTKDAYRLFSTFRKFHDDLIVWIIADMEPVSNAIKLAIESYFGNMQIYSTVVDEEYWAYKNCIYRPQWEDIYNYTKNVPPHEIIVRCDATDVVFQKPIDMPPILEKEVLVSLETAIYRDGGYPNSWWSKPYQEKHANDTVINSGFIVAKTNTFNIIAKDMAFKDIQGIYIDQNLFHVLLHQYQINSIDQIDMIRAVVDRNIDIREDGYVYIDGIAPSAIHCCGSRVNPKMNILLRWVVSDNIIQQIENDIRGSV